MSLDPKNPQTLTILLRNAVQAEIAAQQVRMRSVTALADDSWGALETYLERLLGRIE